MTASLSHTRSKALPMVTCRHFHSSMLGQAAMYQGGDSMQWNKMVTSFSRDMSSLPRLTNSNPLAERCYSAHAAQSFQLETQRSLTTNLATRSSTLDVAKQQKDTHNVQYISLSKDERHQLETEIQVLKSHLVGKREVIHSIIQGLDQHITAWDDASKEIVAAKKLFHSLKKNGNLEEVLDEFPWLEMKIHDLRSCNNQSQAIKDFLAYELKVLKEKMQMAEWFFDLLLAERNDCDALEGQLADLQSRLKSSSNFVSTQSSLPGKEPDLKRKQCWIKVNEVLQRSSRKSRKFKKKDSTAYSLFPRDQVKSVFNPIPYEQPRWTINSKWIKSSHGSKSILPKFMINSRFPSQYYFIRKAI